MPITVKVKAGECISTIAFDHGLFWETVWNDPANAALRELRGNPNILAEGDEVVVPDKRVASVPCATGRRHVFRRKGVPETVSVRLLDTAGVPRANVAYHFSIGNAVREGTSDADGWIREYVPPQPAVAKLIISATEIYAIAIGHLAPLATAEGLQQRLRNLGYTITDDAGTIGGSTWTAIERFLTDRGHALPAARDESALADVRTKLEQAHST